MSDIVNESASARLERSCGPSNRDWIRIAPSRPGVERAEAFFAGHGFDPHRHDTYAIGFTLDGVQAFRYRGAVQRSFPGRVFVLHPDETHDGRAGTEIGFRYRSLYVDPGLIRDALADVRRPLPFVRDAVSDDRRLLAAIRSALEDLDRPLEDLETVQLLADLADALTAAESTGAGGTLSTRHGIAIDRARAFLDAHVRGGVTAEALEVATGLGRYALARHIRACLGTSPHRYLVLRRLDRTRALIRRGATLADAALDSGFSDQSHMTRHFKKAHGLAPGRWAAAVLRD